MSRRQLDIKPLDKRREEFRQMSEDERQELIWESFQKIQDAGINLGPKTEAYLRKRADIKNRIPK